MRDLNKIREPNGGKIKDQGVPMSYDSAQVCFDFLHTYLLENKKDK